MKCGDLFAGRPMGIFFCRLNFDWLVDKPNCRLPNFMGQPSDTTSNDR
jgi:hypothetical protein